MRILITGIAGGGKTTIITTLRQQGYHAIDLDDHHGILSGWFNKETGEQTHYVEGAGREWIERHRWQAILPNLNKMLDPFPKDENVFVGGKVAKAQMAAISSIFDTIYLIKPADHVIDERLRSRTSNAANFAKTKDERASIFSNRHDFENVCLRHGAIPLENHGSVEEVVQRILDQCLPSTRQS